APVLPAALPDPLAPTPARAGASERLLLAELEPLIAEQELGALPVDLHELEVVVERGPRLHRVDLAIDLHVELLPAAGHADQLHVVPADQDLVPRMAATVPATRRSRGRLGGRGRWRRERGGGGRWREGRGRDRRRRAGRRRRGGADAAARGQLE